jgi:hypothetical protein
VFPVHVSACFARTSDRGRYRSHDRCVRRARSIDQQRRRSFRRVDPPRASPAGSRRGKPVGTARGRLRAACGPRPGCRWVEQGIGRRGGRHDIGPGVFPCMRQLCFGLRSGELRKLRQRGTSARRVQRRLEQLGNGMSAAVPVRRFALLLRRAMQHRRPVLLRRRMLAPGGQPVHAALGRGDAVRRFALCGRMLSRGFDGQAGRRSRDRCSRTRA